MWNHFTVHDSNLKIARCDICGLKMSYRSKTANLKLHMNRRHTTINLSVTMNSSQSTSSETDNLNVQLCIDITNNSTKSTHDREIPLVTSCSSNVSTTKTSSSLEKTAQNSNMGSFVTKKIGFGQKIKLDKPLLKLFTKDYQPFSIVELKIL